MNKINIELQLEPAEWDVLYERTRRAYPDIKKEMDEIGEPFTFDDALRRYSISYQWTSNFLMCSIQYGTTRK